MMVERTNQRLLHQDLAVYRYYGHDANMFDTIIVESNEEQYSAQFSKKKWFCGLYAYFNLKCIHGFRYVDGMQQSKEFVLQKLWFHSQTQNEVCAVVIYVRQKLAVR